MNIRKELFDKAVRLIKEHPAFSASQEAIISEALRSDSTVIKEIAKGQPIFPCHGISKAVVLILTGSCHTLSGKKITATHNDGYIFGTESLYSSAQETTQITAAESCKAVYLKKAAVDTILQSRFEAAQGYLTYLSDEVTKANANEAATTAGSAESRLAEHLLSRPKNAKNEVELPQDILKLAKQLALGKDGLFRAIDKLNASGAISLGGKSIRIVNEELLKKFIQ